MSSTTSQALISAATLARKKSYSPYSKIQVGAAVLTGDGSQFSGCNIENASYGGTNCAERVAIQKAISEKGAVELKEIAVVTDANPPWPPCGLCLQVIAEFGPRAIIHCANLKGEIRSFKLSDLLPEAFSPKHIETS